MKNKSYVLAGLKPKQFKQYLLYAAIPGLMFYTLSLVVLHHNGYSYIQILKDPAQLTQTSSLLGFVSNVGVFMWIAAFAICNFGILARGKTNRNKHDQFLLALGFITLLLGVDDFFMLHDTYVSENLSYAFYATYMLGLLTIFHKQILRVNGFIFILAGVLLASSIFTDLIQDYNFIDYGIAQFFEEGFKFVGGATWLYFCVCAALSKD